MVKLNTIPKKEEEKEEQVEEKKEIFDEDNNSNEEEKPEDQEIPEEIVEKPKPKRSRKMSPEALEGLKKARESSIQKRQQSAKDRKNKELNDIENRLSKKYTDELNSLKQRLYEYETKPKEVIKEVVQIKHPNINESEKFTIDDLEIYSEMKIKKLKEQEEKMKKQKRDEVRSRYFMNYR